MGKWSEILFGLAFVWVSVAIAIIGLRFGKWVPNVGTILKAALVAIFVVMSIVFLAQHGRPAGTMHVSDLTPTITGFLFLAGVLVFNWGGFELPGAASEEMESPQRDVPKMILGSGTIATCCYGLLLLFILLVIPAAHLTNVGSFTDAYSNVAGVLGGLKPAFNWIIALAVVLAFLASAATWIIGSDRVQAIAALDGAAPAWMGRFARIGTPIAVNLTTATVGSVFVFVVFLFSSGKLASFFAVMISLTISTTVIAYLVLIPAVARLRTTYPAVTRPFRVPGGSFGLWASVISTELLCLIALITLIWPGFIDGLFGQRYSMTAQWSVSRTFYEATTLGTLALIVALAVAFWAVGRRDRERGLTGETELVDAAPGGSPAA